MRPDPFLHMETAEGVVDDGAMPADEGGAAEQPWSISQEDWEAAQQTQQGLIEYISRLEQSQQGGQDPDEMPDPYTDPEGFKGWLDRRDEQRLAPLQQFTQQAQLNEDVARQFDVLADNESREGEFLIREATEECPITSSEAAIALHYAFLDDATQRYGNTPRAQEAALTQAYKTIKAYEDAVSKAALERRDNQLQTLTGARREPVNGAAEGTQVHPTGGGEAGVLARYFPNSPYSN